MKNLYYHTLVIENLISEDQKKFNQKLRLDEKYKQNLTHIICNNKASSNNSWSRETF